MSVDYIFRSNECKSPGDVLLDLRPEQNEDLSLRTNFFPGETHYVYIPKNEYAEKNTQNGREGEARVREDVTDSLSIACRSVPKTS